MALIYTHQRSKKQARKPGWRQAEAEYQEWLRQVGSMKTNFSARNRGKVTPVVKPVVELPPQKKPVDIEAFRGGTKPVVRPELLYRDNPELLERELRARERKFNVAPAYNKGAAQFVSEDELKNTLSTNKRRV
jgi:hypothetical protein